MLKSIQKPSLILLLGLLAVGCDKLVDPQSPEGRLDPAGSTGEGADRSELVSATLKVYVSSASNHVVSFHRVTNSWLENEVNWINFDASFDPIPVGFFYADGEGWVSVDVTAIVQAWTAGEAENYGFLLKQEPLAEPRCIFPSREAEANQPYLEVEFGGAGTDLSEILAPAADAFIWQSMPMSNFGPHSPLYVGWASSQENVEMQALLRFENPAPPESEDELDDGEDPGDDPNDSDCTLSAGNWIHRKSADQF